MQNAVHNGTSLTRLSPLDCLKQYSTPFGDRSDIVLIALDINNTNNANNFVLACGTQGAIEIGVHKGNHPGEWMCRQSNTFSCKKLAAHGYESEDQEISAISHWNVAFSSRLQRCVETTSAHGMAPFKTALGLGRKPAKMVLSPGDVSGNVDETAIYTEQARQ
ncbi:hypothetical protein HO133_002624 [Letharia lupina]|uniref:Uncharacterized protein n=1 Tax=Letharia lupina TaxID=560253 RepID=A0A8H6CCS8_9LECA|nr:uncharacterized protein HO133_002624 [Letharia lupina]KAF6220943.1 hypothetical protein HO133_002624 [Letharia lupina]